MTASSNSFAPPWDSRISLIVSRLTAVPFSSTPSLRFFAAQLDISESYLRHKFTKVTGMSYGRYIRKLRFRHAYNQLAKGSMSVKQVMLEIGVTDHSFFAKHYKKEFGETPTDTRKRNAIGKWGEIRPVQMNWKAS